MSEGSSKRGKRKKQKIKNQLVVEECFNPIADSVIIQNQNLGCNFYGTNAQPSTSKTPDSKGSIDDTNPTKHSSAEATIRDKLKTFYKSTTLPTLPWIETDNLSMESYVELQLQSENDKSKNQIIQLRNIFDTVDGKNPRRILIESQPGYGKTTLAHKIINDWANEVEYVKKFKFAFLIILRNFTSETLMDEMVQLLVNGKNQQEENELWRLINSDETLLVLDGLDEVSRKVKRNIQEILYGIRNEYAMTIVTTCRIGLCRLKNNELCAISRGVSMENEFCSKKVTILGIDRKNRKTFLSNFIDDDDKGNMMARLLEIIRSKAKMFKSPLLLILLVYVTRDNHEIKIKTRTDLYKQFVDYIIRRNIAKKNPEAPKTTFTLFDSSINEYSSLFYKFAEMCWAHILNNSLQFNPDSETEAIHQLGFLLKHETRKKFETIVHYEGFHLSILEFAASIFLMREFRNNHNQFSDCLIEKIIKNFVKKKSTSLVIPFLCGLLGNNVDAFFHQLAHYHVKYFIRENLITSVLQECMTNESTNNPIHQIVLPYYDMYYKLNAIFAATCQYSRSLFDVLCIDLKYLKTIREPIVVRRLHYSAQYSKCTISDNAVSKIVKNVTCKYLSFYLFNAEIPETLLASALKIFVKILSNHKTLCAMCETADNYNNFKKCVFDGVLTGARFELLAKICDREGEVELFKRIIECNLVKNITFIFLKPNYRSDIFQLLIKSDELNSLSIFNKSDEIMDVHVFTEFTQKKFDFLLIQDNLNLCYEYPYQHFNNNNRFLSLSLNATKSYGDFSYSNDSNMLLSVIPVKLECRSLALKVLSNDYNASTWNGWYSITELTLTLTSKGRNGEYETGFGQFAKFKNLKILTLELIEECKCNQMVTDIVDSVKLLKLDRLEIRWFHTSYYDDIILGIQTSILQNEITFVDAIRFVLLSQVYFSQYNLKTIKSVLQCKNKISFHFRIDNLGDLKKFVEKNISELMDIDISPEFVPLTEKNIAAFRYIATDFYSYRDAFHYCYLLTLSLR